MKIWLAALFIFSSSFAAAAVIEGVITSCQRGDEYCLQPPDSSREIKLTPGNQAVMRSLEKLVDGDHLTGSGVKSQRMFTLNGIDFVGLRKILGCWKADKQFLNIYDFSHLAYGIEKAKQIEYTIVPGNDDRWVIFFVDGQNVATGNLNIVDSKKILVEEIISETESPFGTQLTLERVSCRDKQTKINNY